MKGRSRLLRVIWIAWLLLVITGSLLSSESAAMKLLDIAWFGDKAMHFAAYGVLGLIPVLHERKPLAWTLVAVALATGIVLETLQMYSAVGRTADIMDIGANLLGLVAGALVALPFRS
jgi:VanZ family protein